MIDAETPKQLLKSRFSALQDEDYARVYASYHREAPFRVQFGSEADYLAFARKQLAQIQLTDWQELDRRSIGDGRVESILCMTLEVAGAGKQRLYELALLISTRDGWRYHSAQKLTAEDYRGRPEDLAFRHFDEAGEKIRI